VILPAGWQGKRIHDARRDPRYFGKGRNGSPLHRFDDPLCEFAVCYFAAQLLAAFAETFFRDLPVRFVARANLQHRALATLTLTRDVTLVQTFGPALVQLGARVQSLLGHYAHAQAWSRAFFEHPDAPDGILYRSSHDDEQLCVALFNRAADALAYEPPSLVLAEHPDLIRRICAHYSVALL
jgi:hypothetical protein